MFNHQRRLHKKWIISNFRVTEIASMIMDEKKQNVDTRIFTKEISIGLDKSVSRKGLLRLRY